MQDLISVIIPVYNTEAYMERCLDSVLNNSYHNLEVICVDDGSKDGSKEILRRYEASDPRIVVITKENGGVSSARNAGLDRMTGEYVTFIDSDDFIHPSFFEILLAAEQDFPADIIIGKFIGVKERDIPERITPEEYAPQKVKYVSCVEVFKNHYLGGYSTARLIRKDVIGEHRFPEALDYGEDGAFFSSLWETQPDPRCISVDLCLYYYYIRDNSVTNLIPCKKRLDNIAGALDKARDNKQFEKIYLVQAICRLRRFQYYYVKIEPDHAAACATTREMRRHLLKVWKSSYFTLREKAVYSVQCFSMKHARYS